MSSENDLATGNVLLLTAHPDDEAMFFAPTLLALTSQQQHGLVDIETPQEVLSAQRPQKKVDVYSLCLSVGDADGLGRVRPDELSRSLDILGVPEKNRKIVDHPQLQDNFTQFWDSSVIAQVIKPYVLENHISTILTFDKKGISSHPNHRALPAGVTHLLRDLPDNERPRLFTLVSVPTMGKYTSVWAPTMAKFDLYSSKALHQFELLVVKILEKYEIIPVDDQPPKPQNLMPVYASGVSQYKQAFKAMLAHKSQLVWFRWLYLLFSRYMWVNEWVEVKV
ncbi:N-acetylglucosaminylphosphatidylinositoldeacety la se [Coprinopsis cinerea okayama7|uniref:N-acetylglucosaminylphosphatidylinositol deacetylase n=1 Tax=Coprinopsis cinerea (strain Okayama-7 / 130 / ATCC MYA-4618 / FGSC 9003) TaxID=240176 RepID=A8NCA7_COPC7|nr:N-acetylglucosaminylphosphatidylinositoldeacety la se [Coprinopsis cinerea okayama7\|eukprot:XP_001832451.2 N-acetylglucosaminylphosphatidylinositoldeacety la se [Coprinopsis cinerea okayama7\